MTYVGWMNLLPFRMGSVKLTCQSSMMPKWILKQLKILVNLTERVVGDTKRYTNQGKDQYAKVALFFSLGILS